MGGDASGLKDGADMATEAPAATEEEKKEEEKEEEEEEEVGVGAGGGANKDQSAAPSEAEMRQEPPEAVAAGAAASARVALTITATALAAADQPAEPSSPTILSIQPSTPPAPPPPSTTPAERSSPTPARPLIGRSFSEHSFTRPKATHSTTTTSGRLELWSEPSRAALDCAMSSSGDLVLRARSNPAATARVLTDPSRMPGKLSELSAALEALGTPLDGVPVEVASQLHVSLTEQAKATRQLRQECAAHEAARAAAETRLRQQQEELDKLKRELAGLRGEELPETSGAAAAPAVEAVDAAAAETTTSSSDGAGRADGYDASSSALAASLSPLKSELMTLESSHYDLLASRDVLLGSIRVAMSCLPPPGPLKQSDAAASAVADAGSVHKAVSSSSSAGSTSDVKAAGATSPPAAAPAAATTAAATTAAATTAAATAAAATASSSSEHDDGAGKDDGAGVIGSVQRIAADLCSSARQAAHANARLGHAMANEREMHKAAIARANQRISYLKADVDTRLLFTAQPAVHAASMNAGVAFAALMLPTLKNGLPSHWLSVESVESLGRWCEEEKMPLKSLRHVIGRVVHVAGPHVASASSNPYSLPEGESFFVVHAEMVCSHRWSVPP